MLEASRGTLLTGLLIPLGLIAFTATRGHHIRCMLAFNRPVFPVLHRTEKKEALLKQKEKEKINERRKEELKRAEKKDKDKQAISEYEKWLVCVRADALDPLTDFCFSLRLPPPGLPC